MLAATLAVPAMALSQAGDAGGVLVVAGEDGQAPSYDYEESHT